MRRAPSARGVLRSVVALFLASGCALAQAGPSHREPARVRTHGRAFGTIQPRLSDSGEQIALSYQGALWRMPREGGALTRLTHGTGFDLHPAWSPDGARIAYIDSDGFRSGPLKLVSARDGTPIPVARDVVATGRLHFDRTGERVLANFQGDEGQGLIVAWLDPATGSLETLLPGHGSHRPVALSHDGEWIAWVTSQDRAGQQSGNDGPDADIWRMPAKGGPPEKIGRFSARIYDLCWDAGDEALLAVTDLGVAHEDLWRLPIENPLLGARKLTFGQADEASPSVSRDGRWLLFTDNRHGSTALTLRDRTEDHEQVLAPTALDFGRPTGRLRLSVREADGRTSQTGRISIRHSGGKYHAPPGALYRIPRTPRDGTVPRDLSFYVHDSVELRLPEGDYQLIADRGPEYRVTRASFSISPGAVTEETVRLERWAHRAESGWYSGESHIHANYGAGHWYNSPETIRRQCQGVDLMVCNMVVANSNSEAVFDREYFRGHPDPLSTERTILYWNEEFRSSIWGHMTLLNLKHLVEPIFTGFLRTTNPWDVPTNTDVARRTHQQHGHVNYTHPAHNAADPYLSAYSAKGLPVDVALGEIDSMGVIGAGSNHEANLPLWYRFLNAGFHLPAAAGTDTFLNRIVSRLPGMQRVYVRLDGPLSYQGWIDGLREGRSFVTNGPMLESFSVGGRTLGDTLRLAAPGPARVTAQVRWQYPIERLEIVHNGATIATAAPSPGDPLLVNVDRNVELTRSGWIALRVTGSSTSELYLWEGHGLAHSSPIYVEIDSRPVWAPEEARYFLRWIDRLREAIRERDRVPESQLAHVEGQFAAARAVYEKLVRAPEDARAESSRSDPSTGAAIAPE